MTADLYLKMSPSHAGHIHFVGIGGIGLSALARVILARGYQVTGSDSVPSQTTQDLAGVGATIYIGHRAANISGADEIVVSSAVKNDNPELQAAHALGIPVVKRRSFLGRVTAGYKTIAVAGSHGKTTTTALIGLILADAGLDPTAIIGGIVPEWQSNARIGSGEYFVIEADEYDYAFLGLSPHVAVVTNVDYDHPDIFRTREDYQGAFHEFVNRVQVGGSLVVCGDDSGANELALNSKVESVRYGFTAANDWRGENQKPNELGGSDFDVMKKNKLKGHAQSRLLGSHNVLNVLAALAVADLVGVRFDSSLKSLQLFRGVDRRLQKLGEYRGADIIDDYAHHPAEIKATLAAVRMHYPDREIWALFQPHTYSRTRTMVQEFADSFDDTGHLIVTEIYAARETDTLGVSGIEIVRRTKARDAHFIPTLSGAREFLAARLGKDDVLVTLGAGDVNRVGQELAGKRDA